ncbi:hypothetical protein QBC43DRAFT_333493 [Cladorrhinum sp. PSN259]|nr:hypothetical protein QBC43DRAFT_333493 [Cladorrhinum sp. PSN259]
MLLLRQNRPWERKPRALAKTRPHPSFGHANSSVLAINLNLSEAEAGPTEQPEISTTERTPAVEDAAEKISQRQPEISTTERTPTVEDITETISQGQPETSTTERTPTVMVTTETISQGQPEPFGPKPTTANDASTENVSSGIIPTETTTPSEVVPKVAVSSRYQPERQKIIPLDIDPPQFESIKPTLEDIPAEMVFNIVESLEPVAQGALALASRTLFFKSGGIAVKLDDPSQRYELLLLLARDNRYPPLMLCSFCRIFHRPVQSSAKILRLRRKARSKLHKCEGESPILKEFDYAAMAKYLLPRVHQSIVDAVMESYAHHAPTFKLPLETDGHKIEAGTATIFLNYSLAIVNNHILLKTEKTIIPCEGNNAAEVLAAVYRLGQIVEVHEDRRLLDKICEHRLFWKHCHSYQGAPCAILMLESRFVIFLTTGGGPLL